MLNVPSYLIDAVLWEDLNHSLLLSSGFEEHITMNLGRYMDNDVSIAALVRQ